MGVPGTSRIPGSLAASRERLNRVLQVLRSDPSRAFSLEEVQGRSVRAGSLHQVRRAIRSLIDRGDVVLVKQAKQDFRLTTYQIARTESADVSYQMARTETG